MSGGFRSRSAGRRDDKPEGNKGQKPVSYTHLRAHETSLHLVCRLLLEIAADDVLTVSYTHLTLPTIYSV